VGDMVDVKMVALLPGDPELESMSKYWPVETESQYVK
jgi:hypothetical protein